jgi:hypothetical protein
VTDFDPSEKARCFVHGGRPLLALLCRAGRPRSWPVLGAKRTPIAKVTPAPRSRGLSSRLPGRLRDKKPTTVGVVAETADCSDPAA